MADESQHLTPPPATFGVEAVRTAMPEHPAIAALGHLLTDAKWDRNELTLTVAPESVVEACEGAKAAGYNFFEDLTAVDWLPVEPRFQLSYSLLSHKFKQRFRLAVRVGTTEGGENPSVPSITSVWPAANFYEREVFDLFGINFPRAPAPYPHHDARQLERSPAPQGLPGGGLSMSPLTEISEFASVETAESAKPSGNLRQPFNATTGVTEMTGATLAPFRNAEDMIIPGVEDVVESSVGKHAPHGSDPVSNQTMILNMGPQHPSTHGVLRLVIEVDGETVVSLAPDIGYLHTGIEKTCEAKFYNQVTPLTDRIDYLAPMANNLVYALAVEKLLDLEIPERAQYLRVLFNELTRIQSHLVWLGTHALDLGAMTMSSSIASANASSSSAHL